MQPEKRVIFGIRYYESGYFTYPYVIEKSWYRDRFIEPEITFFPYCKYCSYDHGVVSLTLEKINGAVISCADHERFSQGLTMSLTPEQIELMKKVFVEQKDQLNNHPFMDLDPESGKRTVNREKCLEMLTNLAEAEFILRAKQQAVVVFLEEDLKDKSEEEKKAIREFDKKHRFKSGNEIDAEKKIAKKADGKIDKREALILSVMGKLNCSRDKAVEFIEGDI